MISTIGQATPPAPAGSDPDPFRQSATQIAGKRHDPSALAGFLAALLVVLDHHRYRLLFAATAVVAVIGSVLVWRIKSVP